MAHALSLTASSMGRAPLPTGDGPTLLVDDANAVMITVLPNPSSWEPEGLALFRGGQRVTTPPMSDGTRWVLMGDDRFGTFQACATAAGAPVGSPVVRVVPATVSLRQAPTPAPMHSGAATSPTLAGAPAVVESTGVAAPAPLPSLPAPSAPGPPAQAPFAPAPSAAPSPSAPAPSAPGPSSASPTLAGAPADFASRPAQATPAQAVVAPLTASPIAMAGAPVAADPPRRPTGAPVLAPQGPAVPPAASPPGPQGVVEVPLGEYDGRFAAVVAAIFSVIALVVLVIVAAQVIGDLIIDTPIPADSPTPGADSAARSGRATSALLIAVGSVLLLTAAALAALDVRGRQRRAADTPTALRGTQATLDKAPGILENPGKFRSTLALLITGVVVVVIGFIGQVHWS